MTLGALVMHCGRHKGPRLNRKQKSMQEHAPNMQSHRQKAATHTKVTKQHSLPGGAPMSLLTLCRSMYSDMSSLMMASCEAHSTAQHGTAQHGSAQLGAAWYTINESCPGSLLLLSLACC
jgi:hypothetical protein